MGSGNCFSKIIADLLSFGMMLTDFNALDELTANTD